MRWYARTADRHAARCPQRRVVDTPDASIGSPINLMRGGAHCCGWVVASRDTVWVQVATLCRCKSHYCGCVDPCHVAGCVCTSRDTVGVQIRVTLQGVQVCLTPVGVTPVWVRVALQQMQVHLTLLHTSHCCTPRTAARLSHLTPLRISLQTRLGRARGWLGSWDMVWDRWVRGDELGLGVRVGGCDLRPNAYNLREEKSPKESALGDG